MDTYKSTNELLKRLEDIGKRTDGEEFTGFHLGIAYAIEAIKSTPDANVIEVKEPETQDP